MLELLNVHFTFYCRTSHRNKEGKSPIGLRVSYRNERRDFFTGIYCFKEAWDATSGKITKAEKQANGLNQNLAMILQSAKHCFDEMKFSRQAFRIGELVNNIKGQESSSTLLIDYLKEGNKKMQKRVGTEIIQATYNKYNRGLLYMKEFLETEYNVKNLSLQKLNVELIERYFQFLRNGKKSGHNTPCKYLDCVKIILLPAINEEIIKPNPFYKLKITAKLFSKTFYHKERLILWLNSI